VLRRVLAVVGLVLFLGAFAWLAERAFQLGSSDLAPPAAGARAAEPGP